MRRFAVSRWALAWLVVALLMVGRRAVAGEGGRRGYLNMPETAGAAIPRRLSEVGAFADVKGLVPAAGLVEYGVNVSFWSDGAEKRRWVCVPEGSGIAFSTTGEWGFPAGTVFVKHFEVPGKGGAAGRRLETRVLVRDAKGGVYGVTYRWRADDSDADLVEGPETMAVEGSPAGKWYLPGPHDCVTCHTAAAGLVLGVKTRQLNRGFGARGENQLVAWARRGMFVAGTEIGDPGKLARLADAHDLSRSVEERARSYLDANCSNCHRPGGSPGSFDARFDTPLGRQDLIDGPVMINLGIDHAKVISPGDVWRSIALVRVETLEGTRMPPLGHLSVDRGGASLLREWIGGMGGKGVLGPPTIAPKGGEYQGSVVVRLGDSEPGAVIHYTVDGSLPVKSSAVYEGAIRLTEPTTLRARAFKEGKVQSIAVQETFMVRP